MIVFKALIVPVCQHHKDMKIADLHLKWKEKKLADDGREMCYQSSMTVDFLIDGVAHYKYLNKCTI